MNLILQAIKSLFRKLENNIPKSISDLLNGEKIPGQAVEDMYYTIPGESKPVFEEETIKTSEWDVVNDIQTYQCSISNSKLKMPITEDLFGQMFTVFWDGVEYQCIGIEGSEIFVLGNPSINRASAENTGEPFCIQLDPGWWGWDDFYIYTIEPGPHTVTFGKTIKPSVVNPVPRRYLPEHDHGVLPIEKGGTGATSKEEALYNLGLAAYKLRYPKTFEAIPDSYNKMAIVDDEFINADNTLVILSFNGGAVTQDVNVEAVKFSGRVIPIETASGYKFGLATSNARIWLLLYRDGILYPVSTGAH